MKYCPALGERTVIGAKTTFDTKERTTLYCFAVYTKDTGSAGPLTVLKVEDVDNDFHFARENTWELGSTQVCIPKCLAIAVKGDYAD